MTQKHIGIGVCVITNSFHLCWPLVGLVYQQFAVGVEEQHRVFVSFLEDPAAAVLAVYLGLDVFAADFLLGQHLVVLVEDLQVGVAVHIVDDGVHQVAADGVANHIDVICVVDVFVHHYDIGDVIVIPVGVAVDPEAWPEDGARRQRVPVDGAHMNHMVMIGVVEVGGGVHMAVRRGHRSRMAGAGICVAGVILRVHGAASAGASVAGRGGIAAVAVARAIAWAVNCAAATRGAICVCLRARCRTVGGGVA